MSEHVLSTAVVEAESLGMEDSFRRATFAWALSTKRLVESSNALSKTTKVSRAALADIAYAREMLDSLFVPRVSGPGDYVEEPPLTADDIRETVDSLTTRIVMVPVQVEAPPTSAPPATHAPNDWSAPVRSSYGKMQWAEVDCPSCRSKMHQRCQRPDGVFVEKPHKARLDVWVK